MIKKIIEMLLGGLKLFSENHSNKKINNKDTNILAQHNGDGDIHQNFNIVNIENKIDTFRKKVKTFNDFFKTLNKENITEESLETVNGYFNDAESYYGIIFRDKNYKSHPFVKQFPYTTQYQYYNFLVEYLGCSDNKAYTYKSERDKIKKQYKRYLK